MLPIDSRVLQSIAMAVLLGAIGLGAWLIWYLRRQITEVPEEAEDLGSQFREAYQSGELDADEYQRVREALAKKGGGLEVGGLPELTGRGTQKDRPGPGVAQRPPRPESPPPLDPSGEPGPPPG